jgi:hypothetical protein
MHVWLVFLSFLIVFSNATPGNSTATVNFNVKKMLRTTSKQSNGIYTHFNTDTIITVVNSLKWLHNFKKISQSTNHGKAHFKVPIRPIPPPPTHPR